MELTNVHFRKTFDISIYTSKDSTYLLNIDMFSNDKINKKGSIWISNENHKEFTDKINEAKIKYSEWVKVAKQNNVKDFYKEMDINFRVLIAYFYYGNKITQQMGVDLKFSFSVIANNLSLIIRRGELKSISNEFMIHQGFMFVFRYEK
ncbi:MAG: hypothetical protein IPL55_09360 [Saprospiraceae bacterium]|nr:hypothetical protein [Saprospiraceae bacterium]